MVFDSSRLGQLACGVGDLLLFPDGLIGFEQLHAWLLLREGSLYWLQGIEEPRVALPLVSPFDYVANYRLELNRSDCRTLDLGAHEQTVALVVVGQREQQWTLNLRAPILIRPDLRLGCQVVASSEHSLQHVLPRAIGTARKIA